MKIGYARTSTDDQHTALQLAALKSGDLIRMEQWSHRLADQQWHLLW
jgi:DNA invertase Pin-like site-specific DNA recombinase